MQSKQKGKRADNRSRAEKKRAERKAWAWRLFRWWRFVLFCVRGGVSFMQF